MRYLLDTNILIFHALEDDNLNKNIISILDDYENIICVSSEVVKETMHLIRYKKIDVKQWKNPNDIWKSIDEWGFRPNRPHNYSSSNYKQNAHNQQR